MKSKIDWVNHLIAFLSALLGILIAFQLEDYQEKQQEKEKLQIALTSIKKEVANNQRIFKTNVDELSAWLDYWAIISSRDAKNKITIVKGKYNQLKAVSPSRYDSFKLIKNESDSILTFLVGGEMGDIPIPVSGISTSSWEVALFSGVINRLDNRNLIGLTQIYEWTNKDFGTDYFDLIEGITLSDTEFDDLNFIVDSYSKIVKIQGLKYNMIAAELENINWE